MADVILAYRDSAGGARSIRYPNVEVVPSKDNLRDIMTTIASLKLFKKGEINLYDTPISAQTEVKTTENVVTF